jgi:zinc/manganese transport system permease protein
MGAVLRAIIEPGFFGSEPVHVALAVGGVVAVVCGIVGMFAVMRGQSYAAHGLGDISATGGAGSILAGIAPVWGFAGISVFAAGIMDLIGVHRARGRDLATGIVRGTGLGLAALFLYWDTTRTATTGAPITIMFGNIFILDSSLIWPIAAFSLAAAGTIAVIYRPLLLSSVSADLAYVQRIPVRMVGVAALAALGLAVALSAMTIGAILSTALLVGPAATALRLTSRPSLMLTWSVLIGLLATWLGVLLAYDSYYWRLPGVPAQQGWPVSFFVVAAILVFFLAARTRRDQRGKAHV